MILDRIVSTFRRLRRIHLIPIALGLLLGGTPTVFAQSPPPATPGLGMLTTPAEIAGLPMSGPAWDGVLLFADQRIVDPDLANQDDNDNIRALAKGLVYLRTGDPARREQVIAAIRKVMGTEGGTTLSLGRELAAYVIAADMVGLPPHLDIEFRRFLSNVRDEDIGGRTLISTQEDRPNSWGTHAAASRAAIAIYLGDRHDLEETARVFRGFLGDRTAHEAFEFGILDWQGERLAPVGINAVGATVYGQNVDGVLPDEQRQGGGFTWPPPAVNAVYEALQGALLTALLLERAGFPDVWEWEDEALLRAFIWLEVEAGYPADGDDDWQPFVINRVYGVDLPTVVGPTIPGKNFGFSDWLYGGP